MGSFFKIFFASLLALVVFAWLIFFMVIGLAKGLAEKDKPEVGAKSVL